MKKIKAAFFDRDGTLIRDACYLSDLNQIEVLPKIIDICRVALEHGYKLFVITNQSGIARGFFDEAFVERTHEKLQEIFLAHGITFEKFYYCPHHPTAIHSDARVDRYKQSCVCRKPNPGMLLNAAQEFNIDLTKSLMIGDSASDIQAGLAAGCQAFDVRDLFEESEKSYGSFIKKIM